jgi:hypothetical protein
MTKRTVVSSSMMMILRRQSTPGFLNILYDRIEQEIQKLVRILMIRASELFVELLQNIDECTGSNGAFFDCVLCDVDVQRAQGGEERCCSGRDRWTRGCGC